MRPADGSAGDADYSVIGAGFSSYRQTEPRIAAVIAHALGSARRVLNVGAGAGSYEPADRDVTAVEPSASMRAQRSASLPAAIDAVAERLPFPDAHFDASMATFTVHQWSDVGRGLAEMRRVTRGPLIVLTCDPQLVERFWLNDYAPQVLSTEARRYPSMRRLAEAVGGELSIVPVPIPLDCRDGFNEAYFGRPERLLDARARLACSAWSFVAAATSAGYFEHLRRDLADGTWDAARGHLRTHTEYDGSLRLLVARR